ncbi:MAG: glycogen synthase, partial [Acidimicrobiia bacterium]
SQKGIGLLPRPLAGLLEATDARFVALGTGDPKIEAGLRWLTERFPDQARFLAGYDEPMAHRIEAGADVFMMPSRYEPSGLNQMYSLAYGTPPLVRRTGGLADTVEHWNPVAETGTGFVFEHFDEGGVWWALNESLESMTDTAGWKRLQLNGMAADNSWAARAQEYESLYIQLGAP